MIQTGQRPGIQEAEFGKGSPADDMEGSFFFARSSDRYPVVAWTSIAPSPGMAIS
jgi:hypothetical protein